ncbi:peptide transporter MTD1 [Rhodotorula diobovata]|uniref:Peptide transporter MTD1 n=1 Tax=Rhodotorula diobovata TaxID=5288 RepID=A0A5C5FQG9_9BASI|nr:peptide transporter MTD1 [Rhodotorula diobovata]
MVRVRNPFKRQDSFSVPLGALARAPGATSSPPDTVPTLPVSGETTPGAAGLDLDDDEDKDKAAFEEQPTARTSAHDVAPHRATDPAAREADELDAEDVLANGKERPIETAADLGTRCLSLDDDPTMPIHTLRMYILGLGLTCFSAVLGQIFYFRPTSLTVSQLFLIVISFILGRAWSAALPNASRGRFWALLNPCEFNLKEHVAINIMCATATASAQAINVFAADELYYNLEANYGVAIFTLIGSQLLGYGLAGLCRAVIVFPTYCVYPSLIPVVQLFDLVHRDKDYTAQRRRLRFFLVVFVGIFVWEWIPEFIAPSLTGISIFCLARQDSAWVTRIFGGSYPNEGMGLFQFCFDWSYISGAGPLYTPLATQLSIYAGCAVCAIIACAMYANNVWQAHNFPFMSQDLFFENGTQYDQSLILNADYTLNSTALGEQGLPWLCPSYGMYYLGCNLAIGATITYVALWYREPIVNAAKAFRKGVVHDAHYAKMRVYSEVPMWVYGGIVLSSFAMAMATCYTGHSHLPWWALLIAILIAAVFLPVLSVFYAITGWQVGLTTLAQMLGAAVVPGNPQANMYFALYSSSSVTQGINMAVDLKLAQYTKIPPRTTLSMQTLGTVVGAILQLIIMKQIISSHRELLTDVQGNNFWSGQNVQSFNTEAVTWGALAKHMYGPSGTYLVIPLAVVIGLACPLPFYALHRFFPCLGADKVVVPLFVYAFGYLNAGINSQNFFCVVLAFVSQWYLRKHRSTWFRKYNFLLSAALDGGTQVFVFVATFAIQGGAGRTVTMP